MSDETRQRRPLVQETAARLRDIILEREPNAQIGSLAEVARMLGVGIVTVQQAARILEHEGLLDVRRGPGGGYYGTRPDEGALERLMEAYLRVHGSGFLEALEMITLLDCELMPAAALCDDEELRERLRMLAARIDHCGNADERLAFEQDMHNILFKMVDRPLIELLARVTMRHYRMQPIPALFAGEEGVAAWQAWRHKIVQAVLQRDDELARFEATRHRDLLLERLNAIGFGQKGAPDGLKGAKPSRRPRGIPGR